MIAALLACGASLLDNAPARLLCALPQLGVEVSPLTTPEIIQVKPTQGAAGSIVTLSVEGKGFSRGAYVSFSDPGLRILSTERPSSSELVVKLEISATARPGAVSLYVSNPASAVAETTFSVVASGAQPAQINPPAPLAPKLMPAESTRDKPVAPLAKAKPSQQIKPGPQRFEVYDLGEAASVIQNPNQPKGILTFSGGKLMYEREGQKIFLASKRDVKEIGENTVLGLNTGTFHVTLKTGQTFNFVSAGLSREETQRIVSALGDALR